MAESNILVIKHGALGDIIIATAGFAAIRAEHPQARIVLLTTKPYAELLAQSPYFNEIWVDSKPKLLQFSAIKRLRTMLNSHKWDWVYDLQTSRRSTTYRFLFNRPRPRMSNVSRYASHGYTDPTRHTRHALENLQNQLGIAGITVGETPDIRWMVADCSAFSLPQHYALLVPGGAAHRPEKRWPADYFAKLAQALIAHEITPLLIGSAAEAKEIEDIAAHVPEAINVCGKTSLAQIAQLARGAALAVGNDTGPMHIIAATNCPSTVIFSHASDPVRSRPIGRYVTVLQKHNLRELTVDRVLASLTA